MLQRGVKFSADFIVPIPLSLKKKRYRGFNQAKIISDVISKAYHIPYQNSILTRQKNTRAQHRLNKNERLKNIKGAFKVVADISDKRILVVDDICTTGATLIESSRVLYEAGAREVSAFTLSKRL
jgi:ComF family protein